MKKVFSTIFACLILAACNQGAKPLSNNKQASSSRSQTSSWVFSWDYDWKQQVLNAKLVKLPTGAVAKEVHIPLDKIGAAFDNGAQFKVKYHPTTDSIVFGVNNYEDFPEGRINAELPFDAALYETNFSGMQPIPILVGHRAVLDMWTLTEDGGLVVTVDVPSKLLTYNLSSASVGKECAALPLLDHVSSYNALRSRGTNVVYFAGTIEGGTLFSIDPGTCSVGEENWKFPPVDDKGNRVRDPIPSPDHQLLAFPYYLANSQDGSVEQIEGAPAPSNLGMTFSWSDDGQYLVFKDVKTASVYLYALKEKSLRTIPTDKKKDVIFMPSSHQLLLYDFMHREALSNIMFDVDTWDSKEVPIPFGQFINSL